MPIEPLLLERLASNDETLSQLDFSNQQLKTTDFKKLGQALVNNTHLSFINVSGNILNERSIDLLAHFPHVTTLIAIHCEIYNRGAKIFARNKILSTLNMSKNHIGDKGAIRLARNTTLSSLNLFRNRIQDAGIAALAQSSTLQSLNVGYNRFDTLGLAAFENNTTLTSLGISGNRSSLKGLLALSRNQHLTALDASYINLQDEAVAALALFPRLTYLDVSYNEIGFEGAQVLSRHNSTLRTLIISHNALGDNEAIALAQHPTLTRLDASRNRIGFTGADALSRSCLKVLVLNFNQLGDPGAIVLSQNSTLEELYLSYNGIGNSGAIALADNNQTLHVLNLNYNRVGEVGKARLAHNQTLTSLIISLEQPPEFTEDNLETIFMLSEDFLCISSLEGIIQFFNPAFSRVLGYTVDELLAHPSSDFLHPLDKEKHKEFFENNPPPLVMQQIQNSYRCKDGSYRLIRWSTKIKHHRLYAVGSDITEQEQLQSDLVIAKAKNMEIRLKEAEEFTRQQTSFIAQLSHEIRNPLMGIYGFTESLDEEIHSISNALNLSSSQPFLQLKGEIEQKLERMKAQIKDMMVCLEYQKSIMDDNLDLAKITEKKLILNQQPLDLTQIIQQVIQMQKAQATLKGILMYYTAPEHVYVKGDMLRLKQIVMNLITNAIKYTLKGRIDIMLEMEILTPSTQRMILRLKDTGIGIAEKQLKNLFQRFLKVSGSDMADQV